MRSSGGSVRRRGSLGLVAALACLSGLVVGPVQAAKPKPDLVVTSGRLTVVDSGYAVGHGQHATLTWKARTKNKGTATAPKSKTALKFVIDNKTSYSPDGARLSVPKLAPGSSDAGHGSFKVFFDETWDYGTYPTKICADVKHVVAESKEGNNCHKTHPVHVVPFGFEGTVSGASTQSLVYPGVTLRWEFPAGVAFELSPNSAQSHADDGMLVYSFYDPKPDISDLLYTISGTNSLDACTWSGSGALEPTTEFDEIEVSMGKGYAWFVAQIEVEIGAPTFHFPATVNCGTSSYVTDIYPSEWGAAAWWFHTGALPQKFPPRGVTVLDGSASSDNTTWSWHLVPYDIQAD